MTDAEPRTADPHGAPEGDEREFSEESDTLWQLVLGPSVWAPRRSCRCASASRAPPCSRWG